jgi:exodeoxyribonuclease VII small subunit
MSKMTFENAIDRLEGIAEQLEDGSTTLDQSLKLFEEANKLAALCFTKLDEAEQKLQILIKDQNTFTLTEEKMD